MVRAVLSVPDPGGDVEGSDGESHDNPGERSPDCTPALGEVRLADKNIPLG